MNAPALFSIREFKALTGKRTLSKNPVTDEKIHEFRYQGQQVYLTINHATLVYFEKQALIYCLENPELKWLRKYLQEIALKFNPAMGLELPLPLPLRAQSVSIFPKKQEQPSPPLPRKFRAKILLHIKGLSATSGWRLSLEQVLIKETILPSELKLCWFKVLDDSEYGEIGSESDGEEFQLLDTATATTPQFG